MPTPPPVFYHRALVPASWYPFPHCSPHRRDHRGFPVSPAARCPRSPGSSPFPPLQVDAQAPLALTEHTPRLPGRGGRRPARGGRCPGRLGTDRARGAVWFLSRCVAVLGLCRHIPSSATATPPPSAAGARGARGCAAPWSLPPPPRGARWQRAGGVERPTRRWKEGSAAARGEAVRGGGRGGARGARSRRGQGRHAGSSGAGAAAAGAAARRGRSQRPARRRSATRAAAAADRAAWRPFRSGRSPPAPSLPSPPSLLQAVDRAARWGSSRGAGGGLRGGGARGDGSRLLLPPPPSRANWLPAPAGKAPRPPPRQPGGGGRSTGSGSARGGGRRLPGGRSCTSPSHRDPAGKKGSTPRWRGGRRRLEPDS
ncbi:hypothetical protein PVAP13_8KG231801 [Panicum virgatum]|uniref:Uncharacterized protein n=1 Tax=Panicum virgatum TaxID=38727 RepID=A0A8T0PLN8_PANVG|nr:hypothetical protein PVAP13_8KG231801 [Panicum virgatum]